MLIPELALQTVSHAATPILALENITKTYWMGKTEVAALQDVTLTVQPGEYLAIVGASGSGKSTLMNIIGLLDRPTTGEYRLQGMAVSKLHKRQVAILRNRTIGFVFQRFNLLARATAQRQVELPLFYAGVPSRQCSAKAAAALAQVGLADRLHHRPEELSGGQQQRVAIARVLVNQPCLLLADEPTGALDSQTGAEILTLFAELHRQGLTIIIVTHDQAVAQRTERVITLRDGRIINEVQLR